MEREEVKRVLGELAKVYPTMQLSDTTTAWWHEALKEFESPKVFAAVKSWVFANKWPPTIAEIRAACLPPVPQYLQIDGLSAWANKTNNPLALDIFEDMQRAYGPWGEWLIEDNQWRIKEFAKRYEERRDALIDRIRTGQNTLEMPAKEEARRLLENIGRNVLEK